MTFRHPRREKLGLWPPSMEASVSSRSNTEPGMDPRKASTEDFPSGEREIFNLKRILRVRTRGDTRRIKPSLGGEKSPGSSFNFGSMHEDVGESSGPRAYVKLAAVAQGQHATYVATAISTNDIIVRRSERGNAPMYRTISLSHTRLNTVVAINFKSDGTFLLFATLDGTVHLRPTSSLFGPVQYRKAPPQRCRTSLVDLVREAAEGKLAEKKGMTKGYAINKGDSYQLEYSRGAVESVAWWENAKGESFALVGFGDGMLVFVNLLTKETHQVHGRRSIKYMWVAPIKPAGSVALIQSLDGSYHLTPLELIDTGDPMSGSGGGGKKGTELDTDWVVDHHRAHRFRPIHLSILSKSRHSATLAIQWFSRQVSEPPTACIAAFYPVRGVLRLYALESLVSSQATTLPKPLAELSVPPQTTAIAMTGPTLLTLSNPSRGPASIEVLSTALARTSLLDPKHPEAKRARGSRGRSRWRLAHLQSISGFRLPTNNSSQGPNPIRMISTCPTGTTRKSVCKIFVWGEGGVWEAEGGGGVNGIIKRLRQHLEGCPDDSSRWKKWWKQTLSMWWVAISAGLDAPVICEAAADRLFSKPSTQKPALRVYSLSRVSLNKLVKCYLSIRNTDGLLRMSLPLLSGRHASVAAAMLDIMDSRQLPHPPPMPATAKQFNTLSDLVIQCYVHKTSSSQHKQTQAHLHLLPHDDYLQTQTPYRSRANTSVTSANTHRESYAEEKMAEEDVYRFVNGNHNYSCKKALHSLIGQLPSDFGLGAALEIARCREQKRACISRMAQKGVLDLSPSDFGSLISKDYTTLILHTTGGGAIFRCLPAHQKFQMIQMQISEWEDMENRLIFTPKTRPTCGIFDYVRVLWTLIKDLDRPWLERLSKFLDPRVAGNKARFKDTSCDSEVLTLFLVTLLRLQHLRWKEWQDSEIPGSDRILASGEASEDGGDRGETAQRQRSGRDFKATEGYEGLEDPAVVFQRGQNELETLLRNRLGHYDTTIVLFRALEWENYEAASVVYEAEARWPEAIECRLYSHRTSHAVVLKWVRTKIRSMQIAQQSRLIPLVLKYWIERKLPTGPLEECLLSVFPEIATALAQAVFGSDTSDAPSAIPHFSWRLFTKLVTHGIAIRTAAE